MSTFGARPSTPTRTSPAFHRDPTSTASAAGQYNWATPPRLVGAHVLRSPYHPSTTTLLAQTPTAHPVGVRAVTPQRARTPTRLSSAPIQAGGGVVRQGVAPAVTGSGPRLDLWSHPTSQRAKSPAASSRHTDDTWGPSGSDNDSRGGSDHVAAATDVMSSHAVAMHAPTSPTLYTSAATSSSQAGGVRHLKSVSPHVARERHATPTQSSQPSSASSSVPAMPPMTSRTLLQQFVLGHATSGHENPLAYKEGGYMAINKGDVLNRRFEVLSKLGWGEFSTVWLAHDRGATCPTRAFVALKVAKCHTSVATNTRYEIRLLQFARQSVSSQTRSGSVVANAPISLIHDVFEHHALYGHHLCFTMPVYGSNLLCIIDQFKDKQRRRSEREVRLVKDIVVNVLTALDKLESLNIMHTDLKPENVLSSMPDASACSSVADFVKSRTSKPEVHHVLMRAFQHGDGHLPLVTLADFGLSVLLEPEASANVQALGGRRDSKIIVEQNGTLRNSHGMLIQTREYRAPEVLLGLDYNCRTDIWSLGCMVFELITGQFLMDPKRKTRNEREMDIEHLLMMSQLLGPVSKSMLTAKKVRHAHRYFDETGAFLYPEKQKMYPRRHLGAELETYLEPADALLAAQFILSCFSYDPFERSHASGLLQHAWLRSALPGGSAPTTSGASSSSSAPVAQR